MLTDIYFLHCSDPIRNQRVSTLKENPAPRGLLLNMAVARPTTPAPPTTASLPTRSPSTCPSRAPCTRSTSTPRPAIGNLAIGYWRLIETITLQITIGNWHYSDKCTQKTQRLKSGLGFSIFWVFGFWVWVFFKSFSNFELDNLSTLIQKKFFNFWVWFSTWLKSY